MTTNIIIIAIAILSFLIVWSLICAIVSRLGWRDLAKRYRTTSPPSGTRYSGQSVRIGRIGNYNGCITLHVDQKGLHVAVFPIFRVGHPPLYFPWSAVRLLRQHYGILGQRFIYDLGTPRVRRIVLSAPVHRAIQFEQSGR